PATVSQFRFRSYKELLDEQSALRWGVVAHSTNRPIKRIIEDGLTFNCAQRAKDHTSEVDRLRKPETKDRHERGNSLGAVDGEAMEAIHYRSPSVLVQGKLLLGADQGR